MPAWLFVSVGVVLILISPVLSGLVLFAVARLLRARGLSVRRSMFIGVVLLVMGVAFGAARLMPAVIAVRALLLAVFLGLIIYVVMTVKKHGGVGWGRGIAIAVAFFAVNSAANIGAAMVVKFTLVEAFVSPAGTRSMEPAIFAGDRFLADRTLTARRWDIVVFDAPHEPGTRYVFRIVGLPGETVEIVGGQILVNGVAAPKPLDVVTIPYEGTQQFGGVCRGGTGHPMTLGPDEYFVLGDNTERSLDSRYWPPPKAGTHQAGALPRGSIVGVVRAVYSPFAHARWFR